MENKIKRKLKIAEVKFLFDRVEYCSNKTAKELQDYIDNNFICDLFYGNIRAKKPKDKRRYYYNSYIGGMPKNNIEFFDSMDKKFSKIHNVLSYIEITKDLYCKDEEEAISIYNRLKSISYAKYNGYKICTMKFEKNPKKGFFHDELFCIGNYRKFQFVIYPRYCKQTGKLVLRQEFRISRNGSITKKLKVPHEKFINEPKVIYKYLFDRYIKHGTLNRKKVRGLVSLRSKYVDIGSHIDFCRFVESERRRDLSSEREEYTNRLKRPLSYYMDEFL